MSINGYCRDLILLLCKYFGDELILVSYTIDDLVPLGENFRSITLKISAKIRRTKTSPIEDLELVAKTMPHAVMEICKSVNWTNFFKKEIFMYTNIIPFYHKIELDNGDVDESETIAQVIPKIYGHRLSLNAKTKEADSDTVILLENLKVKGYYTEDRRIGLNLQQSKKTIKAMARFHALGIIANKRHPSEFESIKAISRKPESNSLVFDIMCEKFVDLIKEDFRLGKYATQIEKMAERRKGGWKYDMVTSGLWSTIIHYDFWVNNIMFRNDEAGNVDSVKFIDFQSYCFADIFVDLSYFFFTSLNDDVKLYYFDELIDIYYDTFILALKNMGVDVEIYQKLKFNDRFKKVAWYEFFHCVVVLNFMTADSKGNDDDPENFMASFTNFHKNKLFSKKILHMLQIYERKGWFL